MLKDFYKIGYSVKEEDIKRIMTVYFEQNVTTEKAATLLSGGGLNALQTASVITGLPFAVLLILLVY